MKGTPDITIVVACRNEASHIRAFLDSLVRQDFGAFAWEAIIADGMSDDGTRAILEDYGTQWPNLRWIDNRGLYVSTGLNQAIRTARGEIILRMDAHTRYASDYCRRCVEALELTGADNVGGPARTEAHGLLAQAIAAAYHSRFSTGGAKFHNETFEGWVDTVPYGCWHKSTLLHLGLFDEGLVRNQDDELNLRLLRAGGKIWQSPSIVSWYSPRPSVRKLFWQYLQYGYWKVAVLRRHHIPGSWRHLVPCGFVATNVLQASGALFAAAAGSDASPWLLSWLAVVTAYAGAIVIASLRTASRTGWNLVLYLPAVFATYHVSYGLGFLAGLAALPRPNSTSRYLSGVTR
jgi:glycosyltransferase involved in cell wall biosynthesis